jgi:hypothetical protein
MASKYHGEVDLAGQVAELEEQVTGELRVTA